MNDDEMEIIYAYTTEQAIEDGYLKDVSAEMAVKVEKPLFTLGRLVATPGALQALGESSQNGKEYLSRHLVGDWGDLCEADKEENELSVKEGFRILSAYTLPDGLKLWIITEADRSVTTLLLPCEY